MNQDISQQETRRIIISDMVKKRNTIVPIIGDDVIVYKGKDSSDEIPFQEFILREFQKKYSCEAIYVCRGDRWWHETKNCRVSRRYASDHFKKTSGLGLRVVIRDNVEQ